jgi:hypothetical protein
VTGGFVSAVLVMVFVLGLAIGIWIGQRLSIDGTSPEQEDAEASDV